MSSSVTAPAVNPRLSFYTLADLTDMGLGSADVLRDRIKRGELGAHLIGGTCRVSRADLDAYLAACHRPATVEDFVDAIVAVAPALSEEQRCRLTTVLSGGAAA